VQPQADLPHPLADRLGDHARLPFGTAVHYGVIDIPLERHGRKLPRHPHVEGVMQEQVSEHRRNR
jgi:hypothetical protein